MNQPLPHWDLSNIFPGLESPELDAAIAKLIQLTDKAEKLYAERITKTGPETPIPELARLMGEVVDNENELTDLATTISAYLFGFMTTDSYNNVARRRSSELDQIIVRLNKLDTQNKAWLRKLAPVLDEVIAANPTAQAHAFVLREIAEQSRFMMGEVEEDLYAELSPSSARAWSKLQGTVTSQLVADFDLDGEIQKLPLSALTNLYTHPDEKVRQRAYEAEMKLLETAREPLAACLNGIKGVTNVLNKRRGREDALHSAIDDARIDRPTLEAMLSAMEESFPTFRRYLKTKARRMGKEKLAWWDVFAPMGKIDKTYTFDEASNFIVDNFARFTPDLAGFARGAFDKNWIDAEPRDGKRGGAFCMGIPKVRESRILCNFDGSLDGVSTVAHELGHGYHNYCAYEAGKTSLQKATPMTMAETASIMCETVVMNAVLQQTTDPQEELAILETMLVGYTQVIVDIYSRFLFEKEVFERREKAELSADDFCEIMERAQKATYGDGLDERYLHKYMWTWKSHYYRTDISFYNFPYAFGLLFGIGLYAIYQQRGAEFIPDYKQLLASTGEGTAADLAARFGIDIRQRKFWEDSLNVIAGLVDRYCEL